MSSIIPESHIIVLAQELACLTMKIDTDYKDLFKIGDLSKLFKIGVDSIRYYEKVGLLHPIRNEENNYRYYTLDDVRTMNTIRELLALGFSTDEILSFEKDRNLTHVTDMLRVEEQKIDQQMNELKAIKDNIRARLRSISEDLKLDCSKTIHEVMLPERLCILVTQGDLPNNRINYELAKFTSSLSGKITTIGACDCYRLDLEHDGENGDYATKSIFFYSPYLNYNCNYKLPSGRYLSACYRGDFSQSREIIHNMQQYAKEHNYVFADDPIEFCHIDRYETSDIKEYLTEVQVLVKPVSSQNYS